MKDQKLCYSTAKYVNLKPTHTLAIYSKSLNIKDNSRVVWRGINEWLFLQLALKSSYMYLTNPANFYIRDSLTNESTCAVHFTAAIVIYP